VTSASRSRAELVAVALEAYEALASLGEEVEDEWSYVQDLAAAWRPELERLASADPAGHPEGEAIERLVDEVSRITDPHRAIDWMSTFPQAVLLALGADPWAGTP
jgi:hypothetical protein